MLEGYGSLGRQGSHAQGEEGDEGLHGHTHKRGECVRALSSSFALPNPCLSIMSSIGKIGAFLVAKGGGGVSRTQRG